MNTTPELEAEIIRLHYAEHWPVGTIATQLKLHADVIRRVIGRDQPRAVPPLRQKVLDSYRGFIDDALQRYPTLRSSRLFDMVRERGYSGSARTLRLLVARVRPRPKRAAFLLVETLPGEVAQVDWAYVGKVPVAGGERALWMFVVVLAHSRAMWGEFVIDLTVHSLCRSLVRCSDAFGGAPRRWLFDNPKIVALERIGAMARFHPTLMALCAAMRVEPTVCAVRQPRDKGKVERAIRYVRDRFLAGRSIDSIEIGNALFARFVADIAHARPHPTIAQRTVGDVFVDEQARLLTLPCPLPETAQVKPVAVNSQAFVHFDTNRYSVPSEYASSVVTLRADDVTVQLIDGASIIATHPRSYARRAVFELPAHRVVIVSQRRRSHDLKGRDRLRALVPAFDRIIEKWQVVDQSMGHRVAKCINALNSYGDAVFTLAAQDIIERGLADVSSLIVACEKYRKLARRPVPLQLLLPHIVDDNEVTPHNLAGYDE
jgi:transposase